MIRECISCGCKFDSRSPSKIKAGGRINECADCAHEPAVKYLGLSSGDGKQSSITVLSFDSVSDREKYSAFWRNNSGIHKSKSCQLGNHLSTDPGVKFKTVVASGPMNHKGKM